MKYLVCPPCGSVLEGKNEDELVRATQDHAKEKHGYSPSREEIAQAMTSDPPQAAGG